MAVGSREDRVVLKLALLIVDVSVGHWDSHDPLRDAVAENVLFSKCSLIPSRLSRLLCLRWEMNSLMRQLVFWSNMMDGVENCSSYCLENERGEYTQAAEQLYARGISEMT